MTTDTPCPDYALGCECEQCLACEADALGDHDDLMDEIDAEIAAEVAGDQEVLRG
jgi:hypothetical protein